MALPSKILMEFCCVGVRLVVKKEILVNFPSTARKSPLAHRPHGHTGIAVLPAARCLPPPVANGARRHGAVGSMYGKTDDLSWSKKSKFVFFERGSFRPAAPLARGAADASWRACVPLAHGRAGLGAGEFGLN